jgi:hypothetical protein
MQPMTVPDVYTLVTLLGFYLSEASGHQKAYKELLAQVDDGHTLTLDKVQITIIRSSRSRTPRAFSLTRETPDQVLLEAGIDDFAHHNAGHALTEAAAKFPMRDTDTSSDDSFQ